MTRAHVIILGTVSILASPFLADVSHSAPEDSTEVTAEDGALLVDASSVQANQDLSTDQQANSGTSGAAATQAPPTCAQDDSEGCRPVMLCVPVTSSPTGYYWQVFSAGGSLNLYHGVCELESDEASPPQPAAITPGRVLQAFRRIPLPAAKINIQPPGGMTLVNFETIFSTTAGDLDRTVTLLGRRVQLRITPTSFTWHHGDGTSQTSDWPGRPWEQGVDMSAYLVHAYSDADVTVRPSVDVTYSAEYRLGSAPWRPVDGTVTIDGPGASLRVLEARPVLTGEGR